jgi:hypothetical protein
LIYCRTWTSSSATATGGSECKPVPPSLNKIDDAELARHAITIDEVIEVIWNSFEVRRNKRYHGGYQIIEYTDGGRRLKLIVYEKEQYLIRVITGWDHDR